MFSLSKASVAKRARLHPRLQLVVDKAILEVDFKIICSTRGRAEQTRVFNGGLSKARFGESPHNFLPSVAMDLFPAPYNWNDLAAFETLAKVVLRVAAENGLRLRWGGDWKMDGKQTTTDAWDKPHFELHRWRDYAKTSKLFEG
jgi:peptidoglycan L-alanyl-D-glutamate endopeptidase CwlK